MIYYEPNKNWFRDIWNLTRSWTMRKILFGVMLIGVLSTGIYLLLLYFNYMPNLPSTIFSLLGIVLSILLVFRTNTAYDRWWEGRKQWGSLVNTTRNFAVQIQTIVPKEDSSTRSYMAKHISNFCIALRDHLRSGAKIEELIKLTPEEQDELATKKHIPNYLSTLLYERIHQLYRAGAITDADIINIKNNHEALLDICGACERIKKTPIPFSYAVYIKLFVSLYGLILPLGLYQDFGYYAIPLTMFVFFAMLGLELMAEEIEEPFGLDCNDLPTGAIAETIRGNVFEILVPGNVAVSQEQELYKKVF